MTTLLNDLARIEELTIQLAEEIRLRDERIAELERALLNMMRRCRDAGWNKALLAEAEVVLSPQRPKPDTKENAQ